MLSLFEDSEVKLFSNQDSSSKQQRSDDDDDDFRGLRAVPPVGASEHMHPQHCVG